MCHSSVGLEADVLMSRGGGGVQSPWGVAGGAILGHVLATAIAVLGGSFLAKYISERAVSASYNYGLYFDFLNALTYIQVYWEAHHFISSP